jgi:hypothetical protein
MRKLSFTGFLKQYVAYLAADDTQDIAKLVGLAANGHSRVTEPLFLLAIMTDRLPLLLDAAKDTPLADVYSKLANLFPTPELLLGALKNQDPRLSLQYQKVYQSYLSQIARPDIDRQASLLMRDKAMNMMREKSVSNYRVYTDLGLNPGNINAFLKNADATKVSRKTARAILEYVQSV